MPEQTKPLLSICMIVKNEERCLEKCLAAFQPLRQAIPCELIIADTGSTDRTKEIAAQYADLLFDFTWVNDFSAARNAVIDRASGLWYLSVDADERLDANFHALVDFLTSPEAEEYHGASVCIRNYTTNDTSIYTDFWPRRMARLDSGIRFAGSIHESLMYTVETKSKLLDNVVFHHDGYSTANPQRIAEKSVRNMELLRQEVRSSPYNIRRLVQCIESSSDLEERMKYVRRGIRVIQSGKAREAEWSPILYRLAVINARASNNNGQMLEWLAEAEERFPDSIFTRMDGEALGLLGCYEAGKYHEAADHGPIWLAALDDYDHKNYDLSELSRDSLSYHTAQLRTLLGQMLFDAYCRDGRVEEAGKVLGRLDFTLIVGSNWSLMVSRILQLGGFMSNAGAMLRRLWDTAREQVASGADGWSDNRATLLDALNKQFSPVLQANPAVQALVAELDGEPGRSARALLSNDPETVRRALEAVENWGEVLFAVYPHVMKLNLPFPASFYGQSCEALADIAAEFSSYAKEPARCILEYQVEASTPLAHTLWLLDLTVAAIRVEKWENSAVGEALCQRFMTIMAEYLPKLYRLDALEEESISILPGMHRFGWFYLKACAALERGDEAGYVRLLKEGLKTAPGMKRMVDFLARRLAEAKPELQEQERKKDREMRAMAAQLREKLAEMRAAGVPGVDELMNSPAYLKLKPYLEGTELAAPAGLLQ